MTKPPGHEAVEHRTAPVRWLDADEREAWLSLVRDMARVPPLLDSQLERSAGLNFFGYTILAILSEQGDRTLRMSRLATLTNSSPSRLSHAARHLEGRGLLRREALDLPHQRLTLVLQQSPKRRQLVGFDSRGFPVDHPAIVGLDRAAALSRRGRTGGAGPRAPGRDSRG